jgi:L-ascorbate metabolism protein UlaG (beta-lactamase superfamily)
MILVTHGHSDHNQIGLITTQNPGCEVITNEEALTDGTYNAFERDYVTVEAVQAGNNSRHDIKDGVGFVLTFSDGVTVYISGDTSTTEQMTELGQRGLDYAFFCCDGVYNMDMEEAISCAGIVAAKRSIPYHIAPGELFNAETAEAFDVPNRMIVAAGEEITLTK